MTDFFLSILLCSSLLWAKPSTALEPAELYAKNCATCHGVNGAGDGPASKAMGTSRPRNFVQDNFKNGDSENSVFETISNGLPPLMPAWKTSLTVQERKALAKFILKFRDVGNATSKNP